MEWAVHPDRCPALRSCCGVVRRLHARRVPSPPPTSRRSCSPVCSTSARCWPCSPTPGAARDPLRRGVHLNVARVRSGERRRHPSTSGFLSVGVGRTGNVRLTSREVRPCLSPRRPPGRRPRRHLRRHHSHSCDVVVHVDADTRPRRGGRLPPDGSANLSPPPPTLPRSFPPGSAGALRRRDHSCCCIPGCGHRQGPRLPPVSTVSTTAPNHPTASPLPCSTTASSTKPATVSPPWRGHHPPPGRAPLTDTTPTHPPGPTSPPPTSSANSTSAPTSSSVTGTAPSARDDLPSPRCPQQRQPLS